MQLCYFCNQPVQPAESHCPHCRSPLLLVQRYRLVKTLGQGGFGVVYEAIDTHDNNRRCAIKRVAFASLAEKQQFENEALILKQHAPLFRFVPDLYEFWSDHTHTYMVMECIDGPTLDQTSLPWDSPQVEDFVRVLLNYLSKLHAARTIHRDVKPWNIKRTPQGRYVLLDFGIAKQGQGTLTSARGLGTVNYAPPEQIQGLKTDERSDVYSLAATAYFLLTGLSPVQAQNGGSLPPPHTLVPGVSAHLETAMLCMLEPEPEQRPQSANEALALLDGSQPTLKIAAPYTDATIPILSVPPPGGPVASGTTVHAPLSPGVPAGVPGNVHPVTVPGPGGVPPMPAGPTAQTVPMASVSSSIPSSTSSSRPSSRPSASVTPHTSSHRRPPLVLIALLLVATLVIACTGIWWFAPSVSLFQLPPTQVAGSGVLVSPTSTRLTRTPLNTPTIPQTTMPPMTRTALARARDEAQQVNQLWKEYDTAIATQNWATAIRVLGDIIAITGPTPSIQDVPVPPYDPRTIKVSHYRAEARLTYGGVLQRAGQLDAAQEQYDAVLDAEGVAESLRQQALGALERLEEARRLWQQVNDAWNRQNWRRALDALRALQRLDGFGDDAHDPQDGLTVARLIELAESYLGNTQPDATASPTRPTHMSTPVVVPTTPPTPDAIDAPATDTPTSMLTSTPTPVIVEPTQHLTPLPTAVLLPTYARTPTPTPVLLPTFARTPVSTGVVTSVPTGAATPVPTGQATPVPSGVVSPQPTSDGSPQPSPTGQVQPSAERVGTPQPATVTRVQLSPTTNGPPSPVPSASPAPTLAPSPVPTTIPTTSSEPTDTPYPEPS